MLYKDFEGRQLSSLGFGAMRLPVVDGDNAKIDQDVVNEMVDYALKHGVNYFDTAWGYHDGQSEIAMGIALNRHARGEFKIATKFPGYDVNNMDKVEEIFEKQLEKTGMEFFDFYLIHNVCEKNIDEYLDPKFGIMDYLLKQKEAGRIRHLGFSAHGDIACMTRFLEAYGKDMEFCQIQLNYLDWTFQDAHGKVELLNKWSLPVWVMEPVRGGKLAQIPTEDEAKLKAARPDETTVQWCFRFIQSIAEVKVCLSGMSNFEQVKENIETFSEDKPLTPREREILQGVADDMLGRGTVPCTACRYCTEYCPMGLDIPKLLEMYNQNVVTGERDFISNMYVDTLPEDKRPSACIGCGACAAVCPQQIDIPGTMAKFCERLGR